ncbi:MAG: type II toxin-antitoxin system HicB family antitoxin [Gammaproteobacteria bacterium]|nr:type II toxin-antitoxin system HicB family antitoxin [Gammaproteobacteria bacterium]
MVSIRPPSGTGYWIAVVPDLPGCGGVGRGLDHAVVQVREAIARHLELALDHGEALPEPQPLEQQLEVEGREGRIWLIVEVDAAQLADVPERVNIMLPSRLLRRIDDAAKEARETRSGWLTLCAWNALKSARG